jgi:(2Fe-2S) ferredoxin
VTPAPEGSHALARDLAVATQLGAMNLGAAQRHAFLCVGPDCCATTQGLAVWEVLKRELKEAGAPVLRTKAACLRVCRRGPWLVVYPEGVWYGEVTPERCKRIAREHLAHGLPVAEWIVACQPLGR